MARAETPIVVFIFQRVKVKATLSQKNENIKVTYSILSDNSDDNGKGQEGIR